MAMEHLDLRSLAPDQLLQALTEPLTSQAGEWPRRDMEADDAVVGRVPLHEARRRERSRRTPNAATGLATRSSPTRSALAPSRPPSRWATMSSAVPSWRRRAQTKPSTTTLTMPSRAGRLGPGVRWMVKDTLRRSLSLATPPATNPAVDLMSYQTRSMRTGGRSGVRASWEISRSPHAGAGGCPLVSS